VLNLTSYLFTTPNVFRNIWFEAATVVAVPPPVEISTGSVLKSALVGGLASALSTSLMHPIDSMKVRQHASLYHCFKQVTVAPYIFRTGYRDHLIKNV
jgi:hypothetical protein